MSLVVLGLSHRSAPLPILEAAALPADAVDRLAAAVTASENVAEVVAISTCNRLELYAAVHTFHGAVTDMGKAVMDATGLTREQLHEHLYVHYEDAVVTHVFSVAAGLDSMAVGESQILGQLRESLRSGQEAGRVGPRLNDLLQRALRVGKRVHSDTDLDRVGSSLVDVGLTLAEDTLGPLGAARALLLGAGAMSGLAAATIHRHGVAQIVVANRTPARATRLADQVGGRAADLGDLADLLADADLVVSSTGAVGHTISADQVAAAQARRGARPLVFLDLAMPRDVDPAAAGLPGVTVVDLDHLGRLLAGEIDPDHLGTERAVAAAVRQARAVVTEEAETYRSEARHKQVAPVVSALRTQAARVVDSEMQRLTARLPQLSDDDMRAVQLAVHRIVEKLLHTPTVRVKELHRSGHGDYARALRELFDLDQQDVAVLSAPDLGGGAVSVVGLEAMGFDVEITAPGPDAPDLEMSDLEIPDVEMRDVEMPDVETRDVGVAALEMRDLDLFGLEMPGLEMPGLEMPGLKMPGLEMPGLEMPGLKRSGLEMPGLKRPGLDAATRAE